MITKHLFKTLIAVMALTGCARGINADSSTNEYVRMLIGSYGPSDNDGIRLYEFRQSTGEAKLICGLCGVADPSFLEVAPDNKHFYAVSERDDSTAALVACEIVTDGSDTQMRIINSQPTNGTAPCHVKLDAQHNRIFTANYNGGSFSLFNINDHDGSLQPDVTVKHFATNSHIHCVEFTPDSAYFVVDDLGTDNVMMFNAKNNDLMPTYNTVKKGSGPRHITFAPSGKFAYLINELSGTVTAFRYNKKPQLEIVQYAQCDSVGGHGSADIHISNDGRFLYASNRLKSDGISIFRINQKDGTITKIGYQDTGVHPRNFALSPNGKFLLCACRDNNIIQVFLRDAKTGLLKETNISIPMSKPTCVKFVNY